MGRGFGCVQVMLERGVSQAIYTAGNDGSLTESLKVRVCVCISYVVVRVCICLRWSSPMLSAMRARACMCNPTPNPYAGWGLGCECLLNVAAGVHVAHRR